MPVCEFICPCGTAFEKLLRTSAETFECPSCNTMAPRQVSQVAATVFAVRTGNEDIDVIVGEDAQRRWAANHKRKAERDKARQALGTDRLSVAEDGSVKAVDDAQLAERRSIVKAYREAQAENRLTED